MRGVAGQVEPVGSQRRNVPGTEDLEKRLGKRILPTSFQVHDDPRVQEFQGTPLAGHYPALKNMYPGPKDVLGPNFDMTVIGWRVDVKAGEWELPDAMWALPLMTHSKYTKYQAPAAVKHQQPKEHVV